MEESLYNVYLDLLKGEGVPEFLEKYLTVPSLVRLKRVGYFCGMDYASRSIYNFKEKITRYDHSLTVALLTWRFTKDKKATLAGLFHDVGTPCFSHVIDYMNKDYKKQETTEEFTEEIINGDEELQKYLKSDGIKPIEIINFKKYSIVDNERPRVCADRLDGIILNGISLTKTFNKEDIISIVNDLDVYKNEDGDIELGFKSIDTALMAVETSLEVDRLFHSSEDNYMMELLASITKIVIDNGVIDYRDLYYLDEECLIEKIKNCGIDNVNKLMERFENVVKEEIPVTVLENIKKRILDPLVGGRRFSNISKKERYENLLNTLGECSKCTNFKCQKKSLINIYKDYNFCRNIPSIWTDWFKRFDSKIMIIGQDWGPFKDMEMLNKSLTLDKSNWKELIESEKSNTKKALEEYIGKSSCGKYSLDDIFITNAIMCARNGDSYRGDNIDLKRSTLNCSGNLEKQIRIVKPKIILTLGYYPLMSLSNIFHFKIEKTLRETINTYPLIKVDDFVIIPLYHPVAQVRKSEQLKQYERIWENLD